MSDISETTAGAAASLAGWHAIAAAGTALFAPLAAMALALDGAPFWTMALLVASATPLVAVAGVGAARPLPAWAFAAANVVLALGAAMLAWTSGGALSPAAPWVFAALAAVAILGGSGGVAFALLAAVAAALAALFAPEPPVRLFGFAPRAERELSAALSWAFAAVALIAVAWGATRAWISALPPLRHPTIAARKALSTLAEGAAVCGVRLTRDNRITHVIGAPERTLEFDREELRALTLDAFAHPDDLGAIETLRAAALGVAEPEPMTVRLRSRLGGYRWLEASAIPAEGFPAPTGRDGRAGPEDVVLLFRDRWRRNGEDGAGLGTDASAFVAHVGADLKTSLKSIVGFMDILRNELFGPLGAERYREYARLAHNGGLALVDRVEELLDLADIEAGRFATRAEDVDLGPLIDGAMRLVRARGEAVGVAISADIANRAAGNAPGAISADRRALRRVLLTMLLDAVRRVKIGDSVRLEASIEDGAARFAVRARVLERSETASDTPQWPAHALESEEDMPRTVASDGEARLGRMVATSLAELMGGTLFFLGGADAESLELEAGDTLVAEAIMPLTAPAALGAPGPAALGPADPALSAPLTPAVAAGAASLGADLTAQESLFAADDLPADPAPEDVQKASAEIDRDEIEGGGSGRPGDPYDAFWADDAAPRSASDADDEMPLFDLDGDGEPPNDDSNASWDDAGGSGGALSRRLSRRRLSA